MRRPPAHRSHRPATSFGCRSASRPPRTCSPTSRRRSFAAPSPPARSDMRLIDLHFGGSPHATRVHLLDPHDGPGLLDRGPNPTADALDAGLAQHGLALTDVLHLLLSH